MTRPITQLDVGLINKIAAGEVVERPLSVIKELVENSIDAGASSITVEISAGGIDMMRITDNGSGIPKDSLPLAFSRHATSKIASFDDLMTVETMGFRGEALSSIAAVSQVELITKTAYDAMGTRIVVHGGLHMSTDEISVTDGTTVVVSNLFYNVPARRKFLKKPQTEAGQVSHAIERLALGNTGLAIRYINDGNIVFITSGRNDLRAAILKIYGREAATKLVEVDYTEGSMIIKGYVAKPEIARGNRQHESFFVNGRYIASKLLTRAVESGLGNLYGLGKFPLFVLNLSLPHADVDVNVHPNKMDVRFSDEEAVFDFVQKAVVQSFRHESLVPEVKFPTKKSAASQGVLENLWNGPAKPVYGRNMSVPLSIATPDGGGYQGAGNGKLNSLDDAVDSMKNNVEKDKDCIFGLSDKSHNTKHEHTRPISPYIDAEPQSHRAFLSNPTIIGQIFSSYWLVTQGESLFLVDQHAAHERILYECIRERLKGGDVAKQILIEPIKLQLGQRESCIVDDNRGLLHEFGFETDGDTIVAVPVFVKGVADISFFTALVDKMSEVGFDKSSIHQHMLESIAVTACKAAVKAGGVICEGEAREIIEKLMGLENPYTCPHGRPTVIEITKKEIEKRFGRIQSAATSLSSGRCAD